MREKRERKSAWKPLSVENLTEIEQEKRKNERLIQATRERVRKSKEERE